MTYGIWQSAMYTEGCGFDSRVDLCCLSSIVTNWLECCFNSEFSCMSQISVSYMQDKLIHVQGQGGISVRI